MKRPRPKLWRLVLGFLLAPLVPAAAWAFALSGLSFDWTSIMGAAAFLYFVAVPAYATAALIGVPVYLLLRRRLRPRLATVAALGGLIALAPWLVLYLVSGPLPVDYARIGSCITVVDGVRTWCGYLEYVKLFGFLFLLGALGGLTFWLAAIWRDDRLNAR